MFYRRAYNKSMKKIFKWIAIVLAAVIVLIVAASLALAFLVPTEQIKNWATSELSRTLHREVRIEKASFNIFTGVNLENISVGNRAGFSQKPLFSARSFSIKYSLWSILFGRFTVSEVVLNQGAVNLEKNAKGELNYGDLISAKEYSKTAPTAGTTYESAPVALNLLLNQITFKDCSVFLQDGAKLSGLDGINLSVSGLTLSFVRPLSVNASAVAVFDGKKLPLRVKTLVKYNPITDVLEIKDSLLGVGDENLSFSVNGQDLRRAPKINFFAGADKFSLEPFMALFAVGGAAQEQKASKPGELTRSINESTKNIPENLTLDGELRLNNVTYRDLKIQNVDLLMGIARKRGYLTVKDFQAYGGKLTGNGSIDLSAAGLSYRLKGLTLANFDGGAFFNAVNSSFVTDPQIQKWLNNRLSGRLNLSLQLEGRGVEMPGLLNNLVLEGSLDLAKPTVRRFETLANAGKDWNISLLQEDLALTSIRGKVSMKNSILSAEPVELVGVDLRAALNGKVNLSTLTWVSGNMLSIWLSPKTASGIPAQYNFLKEKNGDTRVDLELSGPLKKPGVSLQLKPALEKALEKLQNSLQDRFEKQKTQEQQVIQKQLDNQQDKAKEEAKQKLQQIFKFN